MLKLEDFFHLPQLGGLVAQMAGDGPGLTLVAGLDARPASPSAASERFLPSGRAAVFRILMREVLAACPALHAVIVTEDEKGIHVPRELRRRVRFALVEPPLTYAGQVTSAIGGWPGLLVVDRLSPETLPAVLEAARNGLRVLSQLDTVFRGGGVARHLLDMGASQKALRGLAWVVTVQRMATLCPHCKQPAPPSADQLARLRQRSPALAELLEREYAEPAGGLSTEQGSGGGCCRATGCAECQQTGRHGEVAAFDVFRAEGSTPDCFKRSSLLSLEEYILRLAALGYLPLDDLLELETDQLQRVYHLFTAEEQALAEANAAFARKLAELEAANRVLQQRTGALISLEDIGQTLITTTSLDDLAGRVCRHARNLCGADRAILYFLRSAGQAEVLAVGGWERGLIHQQVEAGLVSGGGAGTEPAAFAGWPPGVAPPGAADGKAATPRAGLRVPLVAQQEQVGLMIVQATRKARFTQGEVALLQTFANQAALAIQRTGLIEQLQAKIVQLEAAQAELVQKERMERELELARQVQQSVLPRIFPLVPGYTFAARNEPARRVGGDLYDVILLDADRFGVVIADVSDKGMPAALYMALTRSLLLAEARRERSPRKVLANVNRLLMELGEPDMFVTVFYGVVEGAARRLTYTRAGHDRPLLVREGRVQELGGQGTALGVLAEEELPLAEEVVVYLVPGDRLVLYTDGLADVLAPDHRPFGLRRLKGLLESRANLPPARLCEATFAGLAAYQGNAEQYDDMTMLVVGVE